MPSITIETVYDGLPPLVPFDRNNPPDIKNLKLKLEAADPSDGTLVYSNGCYAFTWYDAVRKKERCLIYTSCAKGLLRINYMEAVQDPDTARRKGSRIDIKPARQTFHEKDLTDDDRTERLILIKTLTDLDDIMQAEYGLRVLGAGTKTAFLAAMA